MQPQLIKRFAFSIPGQCPFGIKINGSIICRDGFVVSSLIKKSYTLVVPRIPTSGVELNGDIGRRNCFVVLAHLPQCVAFVIPGLYRGLIELYSSVIGAMDSLNLLILKRAPGLIRAIPADSIHLRLMYSHSSWLCAVPLSMATNAINMITCTDDRFVNIVSHPFASLNTDEVPRWRWFISPNKYSQMILFFIVQWCRSARVVPSFQELPGWNEPPGPKGVRVLEVNVLFVDSYDDHVVTIVPIISP